MKENNRTKNEALEPVPVRMPGNAASDTGTVTKADSITLGSAEGGPLKNHANQKDIRAKDIFDNRELCAQFLRDYADIPLLKHVQPQDIEETTLRYHFFDEAELNSDNVKRIRITDTSLAKELQEVYVVALIEHKSYVDYDVAMQLLRYMVCIWYDWAKDRDHPQEHRNKEFRYPPVIPIVYYEGKQEWTAGLRLRDRILFSELFVDFIPDFTYRIVENRKYTQDELLLREDEISLLMLLNRIQTAADISAFKELPAERFNQILRDSSEAVLNEIVKAVQGLCRQLNLTEAETVMYTQKVKERNMGYLWENAEKMDIQLERRLRAEAEKKAEEAEQKAEEAEQKAEEAEQRAAQRLAEKVSEKVAEKMAEMQKNAERELAEKEEIGIKAVIELGRQLGEDKSGLCKILKEKFQISEERAAEAVEKYWE